MKILAINKFYYVKGGSDRYFFELNTLHEQAGHTVIPFAMQHPNNRPTPYSDYFVSEVDFWNLGGVRDKLNAAGRVLYSTEARRKLIQLIKETKPDIAHLHIIAHQLSLSILPVLRRFGIPIVQTLHEYKPICPTYQLLANDQICERCKGKQFYHATLQRCNNGSLSASLLNSAEMYLHHGLGWYDLPDRYLVPSQFMLNKLVEFGMDRKKLIHLPYCAPTIVYNPNLQREEYGVYIGRLSTVKGIKTLLLALAQLGEQAPPFRIIGTGPQHKELVTLVNELNLNVTFLGHLDKPSVISQLNRAKFSVTPSEWYENFPFSIIESMLTATPVIASNIGGLPELVQHNQTGLLFPPKHVGQLANCIQHLSKNKALTRQLGQSARQQIQGLCNPQTHYQRITEIYGQVLTAQATPQQLP